MNRVFSRIGLGAATVDTVLPRTELQPGETVDADVELTGGDSAQEIEGIFFVLKTRVESDDDVDEHVLAEFEVERAISLGAGEERTIPVDVELPLWSPVTTGRVTVWLETRLDIDWARDPTDEDQLTVVPDEFSSALFDAVEDLGFGSRSSELVDVPHVDDRPIAQKFRFRPVDDRYDGDLDAIEITVMPRREDLRLFVEIYQVDEIAEEHDLDFNRQEVSLTLDRAGMEEIRGRLQSSITQNV